jgi:FKBP-type peptidyl-prolyl cis-trans isomerase SlyD
MKIEPHLIVELAYVLRNAEGELMESMSEQWPLKFYYGAGVMLPAFEENLLGLQEGSFFDFTLAAENAYGLIQAANIQEIPLHSIPDSEHFPNRVYERGDHLQFVKDGEKRLGRVVEVLDNGIVVDFNHSLAGVDLHFSGKILHVRKPRADEAVEKRYIEPNGIRSDSRLR